MHNQRHMIPKARRRTTPQNALRWGASVVLALGCFLLLGRVFLPASHTPWAGVDQAGKKNNKQSMELLAHTPSKPIISKEKNTKKSVEKTPLKKQGDFPQPKQARPVASEAQPPATQSSTPHAPHQKPTAATPLVDARELDPGFRLLSVVRPRFPFLAWNLRKSGSVRLEVEINPQGGVERVVVLKETGDWGFGQSAMMAYQNARFSPPTIREKPVQVRWRKTIRFLP